MSGRVRERIATDGVTSWWDAVDMTDGTRRVLRRGPAVEDGLPWEADAIEPEAAWSPPVAYTLGDLVPLKGEAALGEDVALQAALATVVIAASAQGRLGAGEALAARMLWFDGAWHLVGREAGSGGGAVAGALLVALDAEDPLGAAAMLTDAAPIDRARWLIGAMAAHLANERHVLARRFGSERRTDAIGTLRALATRLFDACPPPRWEGDNVRSDGARVHADGHCVFDGERLDARPTRALARGLLGVHEAAPLRRWLVAASRLRVDRALLARR